MEYRGQIHNKYNIVYFIDGLGMGCAERLMVPILRNLDREDFVPRVCVFQVREGNPVAEEIKASGISVDFLAIPYLRDLTAIPRLRDYLKHVRADLVHTQLEFADTLGNIASKLLRLPSVCTIHTMPSRPFLFKSKIHQYLEWLCLRYFCDRVISVSEGARQHHIAISNAVPEKVITIYNGIDLIQFQKIDREHERVVVRSELRIPHQAKVFVTVAVLRELKGIQYMIRAMPIILASCPNAYYLIVGDGEYLGALLDETEKLGLREHIIFAGMRRDIPRILSAGDIFVLPTLTEALPTVLAEAMAARLPIVASRVGGIPEMLVDGQNGRMVPPGNADDLARICNALLLNSRLRKLMGETGWNVVNKKFNIMEQVQQLKSLYLDLITAYGK